mgnify:CR=1 FL=1
MVRMSAGAASGVHKCGKSANRRWQRRRQRRSAAADVPGLLGAGATRVSEAPSVDITRSGSGARWWRGTLKGGGGWLP